jgi:putative transposase
VGAVREAVKITMQAVCGFEACEAVEMSLQRDHMHLVVMIPPKYVVAQAVCFSKVKSAIHIQRT